MPPGQAMVRARYRRVAQGRAGPAKSGARAPRHAARQRRGGSSGAAGVTACSPTMSGSGATGSTSTGSTTSAPASTTTAGSIAAGSSASSDGACEARPGKGLIPRRRTRTGWSPRSTPRRRTRARRRWSGSAAQGRSFDAGHEPLAVDVEETSPRRGVRWRSSRGAPLPRTRTPPRRSRHRALDAGLSPPAFEGPSFRRDRRGPVPAGARVWLRPPLPASALIEIHVVAVVRGDSGGAVVQRGDQVGAKPRALGARRAALRFEFAGREGRQPGAAGVFLGRAGVVE